jgi:hypothetical protein
MGQTAKRLAHGAERISKNCKVILNTIKQMLVVELTRMMFV